MKKFILPACMLFLVHASWAQQASAYAGQWKGELVPGSGRSLALNVEVTADGKGTWDTSARSKTNPCAGLKSPLTVVSATEEALEFQVKMSDVVAGCPDFKVKLKRADEKTLKGQRGADGVSLTRQ
jgi:hypothetical protein